jgi:hypothetical protein
LASDKSDPAVTMHRWYTFLMDGDDTLRNRWKEVRRIHDFEDYIEARNRVFEKAGPVFSKINQTINRSRVIDEPKKRLMILRPLWTKVLDILYDIYAFDMSLGRRDSLWIDSTDPQSSWFKARPRRNITDVYEERLEHLVNLALSRKYRNNRCVGLHRGDIILNLISTSRKPATVHFLRAHLGLLCNIERDAMSWKKIQRMNPDKDEDCASLLRSLSPAVQSSLNWLANRFYHGDKVKVIRNMMRYTPIAARAKEFLRTSRSPPRELHRRRETLLLLKRHLDAREFEQLRETVRVMLRLQELDAKDDIEHVVRYFTDGYLRITSEVLKCLVALDREISSTFPSRVPPRLILRELGTVPNS